MIHDAMLDRLTDRLLGEREGPRTIPPNSSGHDPEVVPDLRRGFTLSFLVLVVAVVTLMVAVATLVATLLNR